MAGLKVLAYLKSVRIEYIVLSCISLFCLIFLFSSGFFANTEIISQKSWTSIRVGTKWLGTGPIMIFFICAALRLYVSLMKIRFERPFALKKIDLKKTLKGLIYLTKPFTVILVALVLIVLMMGVVQQETRDRLINLQLFQANNLLTTLPLFWLNSHFKNILDALTPAIINSFMLLGLLMVTTMFVLYLDKDARLFKGYIISIFIATALALPLWYAFPANSPSNVLLGDTERVANLTPSLSQAIKNYQPNDLVQSFRERTWEAQKNAPPVATIPSMHWAWSGIIVYYLFKKEPKTIFFSSVWLILDLLGTIYLGNHYFMDGLIALPIIILSLVLVNFLIKIEKKYYQEDREEIELKNAISNWFFGPFGEIKRRILNKTQT